MIFNEDSNDKASLDCLNGDEYELNQRKSQVQQSRKIWLRVKGCKDWLQLLNDRTHVFCKICESTMVAKYSQLVSHACSKKHLNKSGQDHPPLTDFDLKELEKEEEREIAYIKLKIVGTHLRTNTAFQNINITVDLIKSFIDKYEKCIDNDIWKKMHISVNVISEYEKLRLAEILQTTKFFISVDESTDVTRKKSFVITVRYTDPVIKKVKEGVWLLQTVYIQGIKAEAGSERLCDIILDDFTRFNVPLKNIIGISFDGCNTMTGIHSGLKVRLQTKIPKLISIICPAHKIHNVSKHAMAVLPENILNFIIKAYKMVNSAKKLHDLGNIQKELNIPQHKILRWIKVRWAQLLYVVNRIIEQWDALLQISTNLTAEKDVVGTEILILMQKKEIKCYLLMLSHVIEKLTKAILFFESKDIVIDNAERFIENTYKDILSCMMNRTKLMSRPSKDIHPLDVTLYVPPTDFDLGTELRQIILDDGSELQDFLKTTFNFLTAIALELRTRFSKFQCPIFKAASCINPLNAVSRKFRETNTFETFVNVFSSLIDGKNHELLLKNQWNDLPNIEFEGHFNIETVKADEFWKFVLNLKSQNKSYPYRELSLVFLDAMAIPHSNVTPERRFSDVKNVKTDKRNCLNIETINGILRAKDAVKDYIVDRVFEPPQDMIELYLKKEYYTKDNVQSNINGMSSPTSLKGQCSTYVNVDNVSKIKQCNEEYPHSTVSLERKCLINNFKNEISTIKRSSDQSSIPSKRQCLSNLNFVVKDAIELDTRKKSIKENRSVSLAQIKVEKVDEKKNLNFKRCSVCKVIVLSNETQNHKCSFVTYNCDQCTLKFSKRHLLMDHLKDHGITVLDTIEL